MIVMRLWLAVFFCLNVTAFAALAQTADPAAVAPANDAANQKALPSAQQPLPFGTNASNIDSDFVPPEVIILKKIEEELKEKYKNDIYTPPAIQSLMFTPAQQSLIREARNGFNVRAPGKEILANLEEEERAEQNKAEGVIEPTIQSVRKVSLSGIVFINPDDWTIWINKGRVTPDRLPPEAIDLRVYREFIELKWYDAQTNQIFPIRLRPNQTFDLDGKVFLPG